jgi:hypothetical protein
MVGKDMTVKASVLLPSSFMIILTQTTPYATTLPATAADIPGLIAMLKRHRLFEMVGIRRSAADHHGLSGWRRALGRSLPLDSENSGPYGAALVNEMIPYVEKAYRAKADPGARFLDGCSTGGGCRWLCNYSIRMYLEAPGLTVRTPFISGKCS